MRNINLIFDIFYNILLSYVKPPQIRGVSEPLHSDEHIVGLPS